MNKDIEALNDDIKNYPEVFPITEDMNMTFSGISRLIMLDRYAFKDTDKSHLRVGDTVVTTIKDDPTYPTRGIGKIVELVNDIASIEVEDEYASVLTDGNRIIKRLNQIDKPLELFYEQIAHRVAKGIANSATVGNKEDLEHKFYYQLIKQNFIPAGRVLYGSGTNSDVTYFNCYVMPFVHDSRAGIAHHREKIMEIMSRGGGVGTNGSTLRPKDATVHGVNGKSSGAVSWLNDLANLTHLVEQGGSRRGAQMIMLDDWHPDIYEFIISKIQNPYVLRHLIKTTKDNYLKTLAQDKLDYKKLSPAKLNLYKQIVNDVEDKNLRQEIQTQIDDGGKYTVKDSDFLTGANISVCLTNDFMEAVKTDSTYDLRFPDVDNYSKEQMDDYNENWDKVGDVREWEATGRKVRVYRTIRAKDLWHLITLCATYSAEPGIFFIDNANKMTNARAYGQKVVATNPCGEQPLTPYAVCNLSAINLANFVDKETHTIKSEELANTVKTAIKFQDLVIDTTPYFLKENEHQAKSERRIGLGVMGLADMLIYCHKRYGSAEGNDLINRVFRLMAITAYRESIELAKIKGSFPFLIGTTKEETDELRHRFIDTGYMKNMPEDIREDILKYGIRNSHLLTVAPTGSTGTMTGVSTGLEPYFSFKYYRSGRLGKFIEVNADIAEEYFVNHPKSTELPDYFVSAMQLSPKEHVDVQCTIQRWVDSSISKTVNMPKGSSVNDVAEIYQDLYEGGAKGGTVYVDGSRDSQVLTLDKDDNNEDGFADELDTDNKSTEEDDNESVNNDDEPLTEEEHNLLFDENGNRRKEGNDAGNICPICHKGIVQTIGGCSSCPNCKAQLKCGL